MSIWEDYVQESNIIPKWPYPIRYNAENNISADVLIIGGGIAGCHAAINAARKGAKVIVVDKGPIIRSGNGGAGVDHWHLVCTNPGCKVTPEEMTEAMDEVHNGYFGGMQTYIQCKESYDTLLDVEKMGVQVRDVNDEFKGAEFRDEKTKLLFCYDYENKYSVCIWGAKMKPALYRELKRLDVGIYDRIMVTSLLTEGGKPGAKVVGATGINFRTGEFYVFGAKATVLSTAHPGRLWTFFTELRGLSSMQPGEPNCVGDGYAMAWNAGAEFAMMEKTMSSYGPMGWPNFGVGNPKYTWNGCSMVDATGKEIPWYDRDGKKLSSIMQRYYPSSGQKFFLEGMHYGITPYKYQGPSIAPDLAQRIKNGEYVPPLYANLPDMPEHERRLIFGLMVAQEGKTLIPIYYNYTHGGFDPDKDMLQAPVVPPDAYAAGGWMGIAHPQWRTVGNQISGGLVVNWDLKTSLEGLYAAGQQLLGGSDHSGAATSGRYAGRKAAEYALTASSPVIDQRQIDNEKVRVYAPLKRTGGIGWKNLNTQICRVMQDYCGKFKHEETLKTGLRWFKEIRDSEACELFARNPHELIRSLECLSLITVGEMIMHASLARKSSNSYLDFHRLDYPEMNPKEWDKLITTSLQNGEVKIGELPINYWLLSPYASEYEKNYRDHCALK